MIQQCDMLEDVRAPPGTFALYEGFGNFAVDHGFSSVQFRQLQ